MTEIEGGTATSATAPASRNNGVGTAPITVVVVDDHEIVRRGLIDLLQSSGLRVVGEAGTAADAIRRIPACRPDVVVLDMQLPDGTGVEVCREVLSRLPGTAVLVLTTYDDDEALFASIIAGASGYLLKKIRGTDLVDAVRRVAAGQSLLSPEVTTRVLNRLRTPPPSAHEPLRGLTDAERRILDLITEGLTNRQIGTRLDITEKTVKNHVSSLLRKLGLGSRTQAALLAQRSRVS